MTASEILVVILSVALAVFLVLAIILTIYLIVIAKKLRNVASSAERTAGHFESVVGMVRKAAAPAMLSKLVMEVVGRFTDRRSKNKKEDE
jgi:hypothetical protein